MVVNLGKTIGNVVVVTAVVTLTMTYLVVKNSKLKKELAEVKNM